MSKRKHSHLADKVLKIPKTDFPSLNQNSRSNNANEASTITKPQHPPLLLFQLPSSLTLQDLTESQFIAQNDSNQCRLISENKGVTFDLVRVETSNSYILVKDDTNANKHDLNADKNLNGNGNKHSDGERSIEARLLREKNTFFLECVKSKVNLQSELKSILEDYVYPIVKEGVSVQALSSQLMHSKKEIQDALNQMKAFKFQYASSESTKLEAECTYGILSEETEREQWFVIQGVLSEWSGGADYAGKGVDLSQMVKEVLSGNDNGNDHLDQSDGERLEESVVRYCLEKCCMEVVDGRAKLSVDYIAKSLAHYIFNLQTTPWEQTKFVERWHNLMPGVGSMYEPSLDLLKGISLTETEVTPLQSASKSQSEELDPMPDPAAETVLYQKYYPVQSLPTSQEGRFKSLFKERKRWKLDDIEPYLVDLVENSSYKTVKEILAVFTRVALKDPDSPDDGNDWYIAK